MTIQSRSLASLVLLALVLLSQPIFARNIAIDTGVINFPASGQGWDASLVQTAASQSYVLPFSLLIGGTSYSSICAFGTGSIALGTCPAATSDLIWAADSPLFAPATDATAFFQTGAMSFTTGLANRGAAPYTVTDVGASYCSDAFYLGFGSFDTTACLAAETAANRVQSAVRVNWNAGDGTAAGGTYSGTFQILLLDASQLPGGLAGDFDLELNYAGSTDTSGGAAKSGYSLGGQNLLLGQSGSNPGNQLFQIRGGRVLAGGAPPDTDPTSVPEPAPLVLLAMALLGGLIFRRRTGTG